ncbi:mannosyltransferase [Lithohypha guttulata]|uniref:Mannosyltransferase n=1 Tax=Lithohypha guttulata TaxID=1690604 RepID=A0AAN7QAH4_9EURO|nr:mannosyltransferase [Lithohypha guttulata]KAK5094630.1 mannosyltransferase [Lithohypha guttulata]
MTVFRHHSLDTDSVRSFLLDVNPHHSIVSPEDVANKIDGRWIDRTNGKFIDITALHQDERVTVKKDVTSLFCKDGHRYNNQDIYPLTLSQIEGIEVKVPARSNRILLEEYGPEALTNTRFHWYELAGFIYGVVSIDSEQV